MNKVAILMAGLIFSVMLSACGGGDPDPSPDPGTAPVNCAIKPIVCK